MEAFFIEDNAALLADAVNVAAAVFDVFNDANDDDSDGGDGGGDCAFGAFTQLPEMKCPARFSALQVEVSA
eukprot:scaffold153723_cov60-Attheya_sp.AAC.1